MMIDEGLNYHIRHDDLHFRIDWVSCFRSDLDHYILIEAPSSIYRNVS